MNNKQRTTNNKQRTYRAFTLIELVVSIALLTMVISFASVIFNVSIDAHRTSAASAEIMQKFRAITDQLNRDFKGLQKDAPLLIWFRKDSALIDPNRFDQIMFFAAGDFQSIQLYNFATGAPDPLAGTAPVIGNVARVHYSQAQSRDPFDDNMKPPWLIDDERERLLARRRHILTADSDVDLWPYNPLVDTSFLGRFPELNPQGRLINEVYEHDSLSLAQWKTIMIDDYDSNVLSVCFGFPPWVDKRDPNTFHKLMCECVGSFAIQWAYWYDDPVPPLSKFRWFPSNDPDGNPVTQDSQFDLMGNAFGVYFNIPNPSAIVVPLWYVVEDTLYETSQYFPAGFYPRALKFTFTLYDSKGIIKNGREFTHIVYLGD